MEVIVMGDKLSKKFRLSILAMAAAVIAYNVYDNNRIIVKEQVVYIDNLPQEFDDFRILQLSDLHGKSFRDDQSMLIDKVNSLEYDTIVFTGDMEGSNGDMTSFNEVLKGINHSEYMFYVNGNDELAYSEIAGNESDVGRELSDYGCILLTEPYQINRSGKILWISNYFKTSSIKKYAGARNVFLGSREEYNAYRNYMSKLEN
jgi:predicted MPP superfamily phosphohydrolase